MKLINRVSAAVGLLAVLISANVQAYVGLCCGKCGGNMPMNIPGGGIPETYEYRVKISPMLMHMDGLRDGTAGINPDDLLGMPTMAGQPTGKFMAVPTQMDMSMLNVAAGYSFSDRLFGGVMLMYKQNSMDMKFNSMMQASTGQEGFEMKSEGLADTMLMGKFRLFADDPLIPKRQSSLLFGLSVPTGSIDERNTTHPLAMRQGELLPYSMQLGSGTFDPMIGLLYQGSSSPFWWGANATYIARLYDNKRDYRLGDEFRLDLYSMYQFRYDTLLQFQLNGEYKGKIRGEMDEAASGASGRTTQGDPTSPYTTLSWNTGNYGGSQVFATLGLQWQPVPLQILDFSISLPLYRDLNGPQLELDYRVMLTWYLEIPSKKSIRYGLGAAVESDSKLGF